jgi:hypothetical protein
MQIELRPIATIKPYDNNPPYRGVHLQEARLGMDLSGPRGPPRPRMDPRKPKTAFSRLPYISLTLYRGDASLDRKLRVLRGDTLGMARLATQLPGCGKLPANQLGMPDNHRDGARRAAPGVAVRVVVTVGSPSVRRSAPTDGRLAGPPGLGTGSPRPSQETAEILTEFP